MTFFSEESDWMLFPFKSKESTTISMSSVGAGVGLFVLTPLVLYVFQLVHGDISPSLGIPFEVSQSMSWSWNMLFLATGATVGLAAGYLCSVQRTRKYQAEEVKHCFELIINSMDEKITIVDENFNIVACNTVYARSVSSYTNKLTGTQFQPTLGGCDSSAGNPDKKLCLLKKTFETGLPQTEIEEELYDAKPMVVEIKTLPMKDNSGNTFCCIIVMNDITSRKQLEESRQRVQKMEVIGTLTVGIAHDFNNLLSAVIGYAELGLLRTSHKDIVNQYLRSILTAGVRGKELTEQVLGFSRDKAVCKEPVDIGLIAQEALGLLRVSIPANIEIKTKIVTEGYKILADATQIHQVLMNLGTNASHAMGEESGILCIQLTRVKLEQGNIGKFDGLNPGNYLKLSISDTGHGIEETTLPRIFDPFFTTKGEGEGTGLGLETVQRIITSCGGYVSVTSKVNEGTTFEIYFPAIS